MKVKETLRASDYEVYKTVQSRIDPSKKIRVFDYRLCPQCQRRYKTELEHMVIFYCEICGLKTTMMGSMLLCEMKVEDDS